jgi:hypothetical protein
MVLKLSTEHVAFRSFSRIYLLLNHMPDLMNMCCRIGHMPEEWNIAVVVSVHI